MMASCFWDCVKNFVNCFSWVEGSPNFKRNSIEILVEYLELEYFLKCWNHVMSDWVSIFFERAKLPNALRAFGWVSENWDPLKVTRRLSRFDPPS